YLGGQGYDSARGVSGDASGSIYVVGIAGPGFPTYKAFQSSFAGGELDGFVTKLYYSGGVLSMPFSTYLGGKFPTHLGELADDSVQAVSADPSGQYLSVVMLTNSTDLPVVQTGWYSDFSSSTYVARLRIDSGNNPSIYWSGYLRGTTDLGGSFFHD